MLIRIALIAGVLVLVACEQLDPYARPGMWQPTGANAGNLAVMVADPNDLIRGRGTERINSKAPVLAIDRVATDKPKPLLDAGTAGTTGTTGAGGGGGGPPGSGG